MQDQNANLPYTYEDAGFNNFLLRSIDSGSPTTLQQAENSRPRRDINFDQSGISGALGDRIAIGSVTIDGVNGRITITDENAAEVVRIGNLG